MTNRAGAFLLGLFCVTQALPAAAANFQFRTVAQGLTARSEVSLPGPSAPVASCALPWGGTLSAGQSYAGVAYSQAVVVAPGSCAEVEVVETCKADGTLTYPEASTSCTVADPGWANVSALLEFDGALTEAKGAPLTTYGGAKLSSAVFKGGSGSLDLSTGGYVSSPAGPMNFNTGDFTVEFWYKRLTDNGSYQHLIQGQGADGSLFQVNFGNSGFGNQLMVYCGSSGTPVTISSVTKATVGTDWHHYAVTRYQGTLNVYVDGVRVGQSAGRTANLTATSAWNIGSASGYDPFGYFDNVRITKGVARYTGAAFVTPVAPFPYQ